MNTENDPMSDRIARVKNDDDSHAEESNARGQRPLDFTPSPSNSSQRINPAETTRDQWQVVKRVAESVERLHQLTQLQIN